MLWSFNKIRKTIWCKLIFLPSKWGGLTIETLNIETFYRINSRDDDYGCMETASFRESLTIEKVDDKLEFEQITMKDVKHVM